MAAVELTLPSGMVIKARRPGPMQIAAWDKLPMLPTGGGAGGASAADMAAIATFMRELLVYCCLEPGVSVTPGPEEIHPREIAEEDWTYILRWAMRLEEAESLATFRGGAADAGGGADGERVLLQTVGTDGDTGRGDGAGVRPGGDGVAVGRPDGAGAE